MKRVWIILAILLTSCASVPLKVQATRSLQISESALANAQDFERSLCFMNPAAERGNHCTNPAAASVKLTDDLHVKFAKTFGEAFDVQLKAASEVQGWTPGGETPGFYAYLLHTQEVLTLAHDLVPDNTNVGQVNVGQLLAKAKAALDAASAVATALEKK